MGWQGWLWSDWSTGCTYTMVSTHDLFAAVEHHLCFFYMCTVTWRGKGKINSPTFCVWTNKPQGLTAKAVRMQVKRYQHSMTCDRLDGERNVGHCGGMTGWGGGGGRSQMIGPSLLCQKKIVPFHQRKFGKGSLVWGQKSTDKDVGLQPTPGECPVKSIEQNLWTVVSRKADPADSGGMSLVC